MARFVLLYHDCPNDHPRPSHYDLMLEANGALRTWAIAALPCSWGATAGLPSSVSICGRRQCPGRTTRRPPPGLPRLRRPRERRPRQRHPPRLRNFHEHQRIARRVDRRARGPKNPRRAHPPPHRNEMLKLGIDVPRLRSCKSPIVQPRRSSINNHRSSILAAFLAIFGVSGLPSVWPAT